jgi:hypothetical protein
MGQGHNKSTTVAAAEKTIDRALSLKKVLLVSPPGGTNYDVLSDAQRSWVQRTQFIIDI